MANTVTFYRNTAEPRRLNKASYLSSRYNTSAWAFRMPTDLYRPVIQVDTRNISDTNNIIKSNYVRIQCLDTESESYGFDKYYFIEGRNLISPNLIEARLAEDVLYTYKSAIQSLTAYVSRSYNHYTAGLIDNKYPTLTDQSSFATNFVYDAENSTSTWTPSSPTGIIQIIGKLLDVNDNVITQVHPTLTLKADTWANYQAFLAQVSNIIPDPTGKKFTDFLFKAYSLPTSVSGAGAVVQKIQTPGILTIDITGIAGHLQQLSATEEVYSTFVANVGNVLKSGADEYQNISPFSTWQIQFHPFGVFDIDYNDISSDGKIYLRVYVNQYTGNARVYVGPSIAALPNRYVTSGNVARNYPISIESYNVNALSHISGIVGMIGGIASGNAGIAVSSALGEVGNITHDLTANTTVKAGSYEYVSPYPTILVRQALIAERDATKFGYPCNQTLTLSSCSGYTEVAEVHVEGSGFESIDETERREIENILKTGFIA